MTIYQEKTTRKRSTIYKKEEQGNKENKMCTYGHVRCVDVPRRVLLRGREPHPVLLVGEDVLEAVAGGVLGKEGRCEGRVGGAFHDTFKLQEHLAFVQTGLQGVDLEEK